MDFLYKLFRKDPKDRDSVVMVTSVSGIVINLIIAAVKLVMGLAVSSIAIISEGVNNATDAVTSVIAIVGTKLSGKKPDKTHPFGYGRIEYLTSLIISVLILVSGVEMVKSSIELIIHPEPVSISTGTLIIIAVSGVIKFLQGMLTIRAGRRVESGALVAVGTECRNDAFVSLVTILSFIIFLLSGVSVDAYAGLITSVFILKAGFDVLRETVSELLGRSGKKELADTLYAEIRATDGIINAADMMLHNYGPDAWSGSVNVELDRKLSVGEVYAVLHKLQLRIMHEYKVTMVFGVYAVNNDTPEAVTLRREIAAFVRMHEHVLSYHALYIDEDEKRIYCDFIADYELKDWESLEKAFEKFMAEKYPGYSIELTVETEFV